MKTKVFCSLLVCLSLISCSKEKNDDNWDYVQTPSELIGSWNWNNTFGGMALVTYDPTNTGKSIRIEIDHLNTYKYFTNDTLKYQSKFRIAKTLSVFNQKDTVLMIIIETSPRDLSKKWNDNISYCYLSFRTSDTLIFRDASYDGLDHTYSRLK